MQGFVPKDADAAGITKELTTHNLQGEITKTDMSTKGFGVLAQDISTEANRRRTCPLGQHTLPQDAYARPYRSHARRSRLLPQHVRAES